MESFEEIEKYKIGSNLTWKDKKERGKFNQNLHKNLSQISINLLPFKSNN